MWFFIVSVVLKERRSKDSVTLAWQGPERPIGAIVEYEVIYYEKVRELQTVSFFLHDRKSHMKESIRLHYGKYRIKLFFFFSFPLVTNQK